MLKKMTTEHLAIMMQKEFVATRKEMATNLTGVKTELEERIRDLGHDITRMERKLDGVPSIAEFDELRKRLARVEKKVGLA